MANEEGFQIDDGAPEKGWNFEAAEDLGLAGWLKSVDDLDIEIQNWCRGAGPVNGTTVRDLTLHLASLKTELENVIENVAGGIVEPGFGSVESITQIAHDEVFRKLFKSEKW
tara:strand:+ start:812 stop:1147 length:336 start_codon:yes stop_codon:yes gene_type:complete